MTVVSEFLFYCGACVASARTAHHAYTSAARRLRGQNVVVEREAASSAAAGGARGPAPGPGVARRCRRRREHWVRGVAASDPRPPLVPPRAAAAAHSRRGRGSRRRGRARPRECRGAAPRRPCAPRRLRGAARRRRAAARWASSCRVASPPCRSRRARGAAAAAARRVPRPPAAAAFSSSPPPRAASALLLALARLQLPPEVPPVRVERTPLPARVGPVLPQRRHVRRLLGRLARYHAPLASSSRTPSSSRSDASALPSCARSCWSSRWTSTMWARYAWRNSASARSRQSPTDAWNVESVALSSAYCARTSCIGRSAAII